MKRKIIVFFMIAFSAVSLQLTGIVKIYAQTVWNGR